MNKFFCCMDNYLSKEECDKYIQHYNDNNNLVYTAANESKPIPIQFDKRLQQIIKDFNIPYELENLEIVKRGEGSFMDNHYDTNHTDEVDKFAFLIYLNEDFEGGETVIEEETTIVPKTGRILLFTNGILFHKVNKIIKGDRYVIAGWFI